jgi:hypothetical protein
MDKFRIKIKQRMFLGGIFCAFTAGLGILQQLGIFEKPGFFKKYELLSSFQLGFLIGIGLVAVFMMFKMGNALKDETKLKILYHEEHDERLSLIRQKSGMPMLAITSCIMIFAGIIAGYVNEIVFFTLIAAAILQIIISLFVKLYYMKKM